MHKIGILFLSVFICPLLLVAEEKCRLNTDRSIYAIGETIWLRGWVTDDETGTPTSKFLYVELLRDGMASVEKRIKIKERNGMFFGQMELPNDLGSGWYTLRAYTRAQKDWPAEALFHTRVLILGAGPVPSLYAMKPVEPGNYDIYVSVTPTEEGHLAVTLSDIEGKPVAGNFALSVVKDSYADFDFQTNSSETVYTHSILEGEREYRQEMVFRIKSLHRKLPKKYQVSVISQDIGYYQTEEVAYDKRLLTKEGQSFQIPDLDYPEGTLFTVNVIGSMFIYPEEEPGLFAEPYDYGPTYSDYETISDTLLFQERLAETFAPIPAYDTIATSVIVSKAKESYYRPERPVGPYSNVFEWRQVRLREDMRKYDDMNLLTYISHTFPGIQVGWTESGRILYTTRGASVRTNRAEYHTVELYIDNMRMDDWKAAENYTVRDVQTLFVLRGQEAALYRATAVVLLETRRIDPAYLAESSPTSIKTIGIRPLGYQTPRSFDSVTSLTTDRQGTYYWNPCIRTDVQGHADIALPEFPEGYYLRLVGQTLDGRWFAHRIILGKRQ